MEEELKYVGKSLTREDAFDKARGRTKYICDMERPGMLYAKLVLSRKAHSDITVDASEALKVEGVVAVYTHEDVPKIKYNAHNWYPGANALEDQYILSEKARYMGDHIALVVGTHKKAVEEGVRLVKVTYEELPAVIGLDAAKADEKNLAFAKTMLCGDYEEAARKAYALVSSKGSTQKIHHSAIEPHIALGEPDENGNLMLYSPCQVVHQIQYHISRLLELPFNRVRVIKTVMGGSFGGKGQTVVEPACAFAALKLGKPVMLYMDREDAIMATRTRNASRMEIETAVSRDGIILGRKISCEVDGGAYYTNAAAVAMALGKKLFRLYRVKNQICDLKAYYTNTIPGGACRGYGSPQAHAVTEVNLDLAAKKIGMDPCELRLRNVVQPMDDDPIGGPNLGNARIEECIRKGMEAFDWQRRRAHVKEKNTKRYAYGVGMACAAHGNGYKGAYPDFTNVAMVIYPDSSVAVKIGIHDLGCGTVTTMQQLAAEALHIDIRHVKVYEADTFITPYDSAGTQASRVTYVCGRAVQLAGEQLREKLMEACGRLYGWSREDMRLEDGLAVHIGEEKTYGQVAADYEKNCARTMSTSLEYESPANPATYACCFVEVKVDRYTGMTEITDCLAVHDIGRAINPQLAVGQILGGAQMSLGMALFEQMDIDGSGQVKSRNFSKYHIINAPDMPRVRTILVEAKEPNGPYGAKSIGEIAAVAPAPAVVNGINFALDSEFADYPVTPEKIIRKLYGTDNI